MTTKLFTLLAAAGAFVAVQGAAHADVSPEKFGSLFYHSTAPSTGKVGGSSEDKVLSILLRDQNHGSWKQMKGQSFSHDDDEDSNHYGLYAYLSKRGQLKEGGDDEYNWWNEGGDEYCPPPPECIGNDCGGDPPGGQGLPEPTALLLMGAGLLGVGALRRRVR